jgi:hypothetical protein
MAGIDYTIPNQIKGIQLESPMNAMAQAMQLRGLQEASQMNALRAQEYELKTQEAREMSQQRNALAQYLANPKRPTDALELEAGVRQVAPLLADQFVDTQLRRADLGIRTKEHEAKTFEIKTKEEERKRAMSKEQFQDAVGDLVSYDTVDHVLAALEQKLNAGQITQAQKDQVIAGLPNNDSEIPAWQIRTVRGMLTPKERVEDIRAEAKLSREDAAAKEKQRKAEQKQAYLDYVFDAAEKGEDVMTEAEFVASPNQQPATAVATARVTPAAASTTTAAPTTVATTAPDGTKELPSVEIVAGTYGVHPQARAFYRAGNKVMGDAIQAAHVAEKKRLEEEKKRGELSGEFLNVVNAEQMIAELEKNPTTLNLKKIASLRKQINAANESKAPRISQKVEVSTEKKYGEKFAGNIADADVALRDAAERAPDTAANANRILSLLQSGQVITGSAANVKLQMAKFLNLGGGNDSEAVTNTEVLISSLADSTLGAIKSSGLGSGQGFTDKDREFLERAKSGQITYEAASLKRLAELAHKAAAATADKWNKRVKTIPKSAIEGTGISTDAVSVPALLKSNIRSQLPAKNADGWELKEDANGRRAYVSPDGKQYKEVK